MMATAPARHAAFPVEILAQLEAFCAEQRTGKIEIDIRNGQVMVVKATESLFDTNRPKK